MRVQHNIASMNSYRNYNNNTSAINKNLEKLSSGYKINRAGDDAAGLAISEKMRAQITGLEGAQKNAKDGIRLVQTAEGALTEVHSMLNRMYSLAEQSANGTYDTKTDRAQLQKEVDALLTEINRISESSDFNGQKLFNGELAGPTAKAADDNTAAYTVKVAFASGVTDAQKDAFNTAIDDKSISLSKATVSNTDYVKFDLSAISGYSIDTVKAGSDTLTNSANGVEWDNGTGKFSSADDGSTITLTLKDSSNNSIATLTFDNVTDESLTNITAAQSFTLKSGKALTLQIGDTAASYNQMEVGIQDLHIDSLGIDTIAQGQTNSIETSDGAASAMALIKNAINTVSDVRGGLGAIQNRLEHTINNLSVMQENIQDAESTIRDTDVADEMMKYTKNSILVQSAQAMLAQANQQPQGVLQLLQ